MFHKHVWEVVEWSIIDVYHFEANGNPDRIDTRFRLMCFKCGKDKTKRIKNIHMDAELAAKYCDSKGWKF